MNITEVEVRELELHAIELRESVVNMLEQAGSGHTAGPLGMADIFAALYFKILKHNPANPFWVNRDRLILSNGHICPIMYAAMAHSGYFNISELLTLRKFGSMLQGHPHREFLPFLETSSGPLGCGLSQAIGMALANRIKGDVLQYYYVIMGDGEMNEGQVWEALLMLGKEKLNNIIVIVDRNRIQIDGNTENVMPLEPLAHKLDRFNLNVLEIDGHDMRQIITAVSAAKSSKDKASIIIANTIPGKGWHSIEGNYAWHGKAPNKFEADLAIDDMQTEYRQVYNRN